MIKIAALLVQVVMQLPQILHEELNPIILVQLVSSSEVVLQLLLWIVGFVPSS